MPKKLIRKFNYVIDDLDSIFKYLDIRNKYQRITLLAHSMGAHHGLRYELAHPIFDHLILNSPMVGILDSDETKKNYYLTLLLISLGMGETMSLERVIGRTGLLKKTMFLNQ